MSKYHFLDHGNIIFANRLNDTNQMCQFLIAIDYRDLKYKYYLKFPFKAEIYIISKNYFVKTILYYIAPHGDKITFSLYTQYQKIFSSKETSRYGIELYTDSGTICPTCISLMRCFDECAPVLKTKIGQLIL